LVSGAAAIVKQLHPGYSPAEVKSALVNTASQEVTRDEAGHNIGIQALGGGRLDAGAAVQSTLLISPALISFGVPASLPVTKQFQIANRGSSTANLSLAIVPSLEALGTTLALDQTSLSVTPGASATFKLTLSGTTPAAGSYSGFVIIQNGASTLRVPYQFLIGSGTAANLILLTTPADAGLGGDAGPLVVRLIDANGVPVSGVPVSFTVTGDASYQDLQSTSDQFGIAGGEAILGSTPGNYTFGVRVAGMGFSLAATALPAPVISDGGVLNAANPVVGQPIAPGSYVSIFGSNLAFSTGSASAAILPLAIDYTTVSFDVPSANLSLPGHITYSSPTQVNVQVPWELAGQSSVQVKVTAGDPFGIVFGNVITVPLADYAPAFFEIGGGEAAALDAQFKVVSSSNPVRSGQTIQLFANGLGPVDNPPASGDPATTAASTCKAQATLTIGNLPVSPTFCGLAPGFAGLYQVNADVPANLAPGTYPVSITIGGQKSKASSIAVQ
jgi:uncharacterized protein (TIGR03437 family)